MNSTKGHSCARGSANFCFELSSRSPTTTRLATVSTSEYLKSGDTISASEYTPSPAQGANHSSTG